MGDLTGLVQAGYARGPPQRYVLLLVIQHPASQIYDLAAAVLQINPLVDGDTINDADWC